MRPRIPSIAAALLLATTTLARAEETQDVALARLATLDRAALGSLLVSDDPLSPLAHYELARRERLEASSPALRLEEFRAARSAPEVIAVTPGGGTPVAIVLFDPPPPRYGYAPSPASDGRRLFGPRAQIVPRVLGFEAFHADGTRALLDEGEREGGAFVGVLRDLDGDGRPERVREVEGSEHLDALIFERITEPCEPLFALFHGDAHLWRWSVEEGRPGQPPGIVLARRDDGAFTRVASIRWSPAERRFEATGASIRDGFYSASGALRVRAEAEWAAVPLALAAASPPGPRWSRAYVLDGGGSRSALVPPRPSLAREPPGALTHADVVRSVRAGHATPPVRWISRLAIPEGFWTAPPRDAALALAEENRSDAHRAIFRLAVDDLDGARPPTRTTVVAEYRSSECYVRERLVTLLRCDPAGSFLASARRAAPTGLGSTSGALRNDPLYAARVAPIAYDDARRLSDVLWTLARIRSREVASSERFFEGCCTADGWGSIDVRSERGSVAASAGRIRATDGALADGARGYGDETFANLALALLCSIAPARLDAALEDAPPLGAEDAARLLDAALPEGATPTSQALAEIAVEIAGDRALALLGPRLASLERRATPYLAGRATLALDQIASANDIGRLRSWAVSDAEGYPWALRRLEALDHGLFFDALQRRRAATSDLSERRWLEWKLLYPDAREGAAPRSGPQSPPEEGPWALVGRLLDIAQEPDPLTRARLLAAFAIEHGLRPEAEGRAIGRALSPDQRRALARFLDWYETEALAARLTRRSEAQVRASTCLLRVWFAMGG